jgi:hypothetical protein
MDDIIPDTQLDQRKEKSCPSASNSPAAADNDLPVTRQQAARARDLTSATSPGVDVPENDDYVVVPQAGTKMPDTTPPDFNLSTKVPACQECHFRHTNRPLTYCRMRSRSQTLQTSRDGESQINPCP